MLRPKASRLLEFLLSGHPVRLPNHQQDLEAGETEDGTPVVGFRMLRYPCGTGGPAEEVVFGYDITLNDFLRLAQRMPEDNLFIMGCEVALTGMAQERAARRMLARQSGSRP